jgi:hypothetical protein
MQKNKIGCGLITCDRDFFYKNSVTSLSSAAKNKNIEFVVINDGLEKLSVYPDNFIETGGKKGVAVAKNLALKFLLNSGCEHIFLMEDDIEIVDDNVFDHYIHTANKTGILHLNYGLHGNHNKKQDGSINLIKTINYPNNSSIDLYGNLLGAFSYYHRSVLDKIGLMHEEFYNAMEHVHHTYLSIVHNFHPPFRYFADAHDSSKYLKDILPDHQQSKIRNENFQETFKKGLDIFIKKTGFSVVYGYGPEEKITTEKECLNKLKEIYNNAK